MTGLQPAGFPHSDIMGSMPACGSPMLFAACHVLLRRLVPWHPPCALVRLIFLRMTFVIVDPETNCLIYFSGKLLPIFLATGLQRLFSRLSFYVRLSRCMRNFFRSGTNPENDTDFEDDSYFFSATLGCSFSNVFRRYRPMDEASDFSSACSLERR